MFQPSPSVNLSKTKNLLSVNFLLLKDHLIPMSPNFPNYSQPHSFPHCVLPSVQATHMKVLKMYPSLVVMH